MRELREPVNLVDRWLYRRPRVYLVARLLLPLIFVGFAVDFFAIRSPATAALMLFAAAVTLWRAILVFPQMLNRVRRR